MKKNPQIIVLLFCLFLALAGKPVPVVGNVENLKKEIQSHSSEIQQIEKEIAEYSQRLSQVKSKANTLQTEIERIDLTRQKLSADINLTTKEIQTTELTLEKLNLEIADTEKEITNRRMVMAEAIKKINLINTDNIVEIFLTHNSLSDFLQETNALERLQEEMKSNLLALQDHQVAMAIRMTEEERERQELSTLQNRLASQKSIVDRERTQQNALLTSTRNEESTYQQQLAKRLEQKKQIEAEIRRIEEQIRVVIDPSSLPSPGSGVLRWPLKEVRITQYFGNTPFATQNPQVYSGKGHSGIDLAASVGTPTYAVADGRVTGIDDTDRVCPGASYGKWLLLEHANGLSTLYAHLSHTPLKEGDAVKAGQEIAYTGNSGYTTGPHLHFEVLVTSAVRVTDGITELKSKSCAGAVYRLPLSGFNGKLNPLSYL
ncbi:MAG: peptidoglycan DD-metalloendopeptidase family protein [Candidatus Paceibacterota bacterium]